MRDENSDFDEFDDICWSNICSFKMWGNFQSVGCARWQGNICITYEMIIHDNVINLNAVCFLLAERWVWSAWEVFKWEWTWQWGWWGWTGMGAQIQHQLAGSAHRA